MRRAPLSEQFGWLIVLLTATTAAVAEEPAQWLQRMNHALTTRNYDGTFAHWHGGRVEMLRIIHRVQGGKVAERLVSLDGSGREFIRTGSELACYLPDQRTVVVEQRPKEQALLSGLPAINPQMASFYDIAEIARTRLNRHDTRVITVAPKDGFRYGYRLWIDETTGMPLKTQLCDAKGRVMEQVVFASLTLPAHIPDSALKPEVSTEGFRWLRNETLPAKESVENAAMSWNSLSLPPGFRMTARSSQLMPGSSDPVSHLVFTDGLASVSVFLEMRSQKGANERTAGGDQQTGGKTDEQTISEESARVGSSSVFSVVVGRRKVTAVGEVPPATVRSIAASFLSSQEGGDAGRRRPVSDSAAASPALDTPRP